MNLGEAARELGVSVDEFRRLAGEAKTNGGVVDGRRFPAPKGGLNPTYAVAGLRVWKNPDTGLVDIHGVADMIGVNQKTVRKYATEDYAEDHPDGRAPWFPRPDDVGLWKAVDIRAWLAARAEAGPTPRPKGLYACGRCSTEVPRRWKFKPTEDPADEELLCKPCLVVADREKTILEAVESVVSGWYPPGVRIDWDDFLDRVEEVSGVDLGEDMLSPLIVRAKAYAKELRKAE